jgi:predicted nucleic acid-binding protein
VAASANLRGGRRRVPLVLDSSAASPPGLRRRRARSADPGDDYLLALAESEKAIVASGDRHLLELADRFPIRSPRGFLDMLETRR